MDLRDDASLPGWTPVALALILAAASGGCIQSSQSPANEHEASTIGLPEALELAASQAEDWDEDAELAMAMALEAADPDAVKDPSTGGQAAGPSGPQMPNALREGLETPDPNVGDGQAWAWSLVYLVEETDDYRHFLVYGTDRTVEQAPLPDRDKLPNGTVESWDVNASEAVDALPTDRSGETVPDPDEGAIGLILSHPRGSLPSDWFGDDPLWTVLIPAREGEPGDLAFVNARTGEVSSLAELVGGAIEQERRKQAGVSPDEEIPEPPIRTLSFNRTLQDGGATEPHNFSVEPGEGQVEIRYEWHEPEIEDDVKIRVDTPEGPETKRIRTFGSGPGFPMIEHTLEDPPPGEFASQLNITADHNVSEEIPYRATIEIYEGPEADPVVQREVTRSENGTVTIEGTLRPSYPSTWPQPTTNLTEEAEQVRLRFLWDGGAIYTASYTLEREGDWIDHDERFEHRIEGELRGVEWHYDDVEPGTYTAEKTGHGTVASDVPLPYKLELVVR